MDQQELRLAVAKARRRLRTIEDEMEHLREESRSYRRLGFGQDIKDIQLSALEDQRQRQRSEIGRLERALGRRGRRGPDLGAWLLAPALWLVLAVGWVIRLPGRATAGQALRRPVSR